MPLTACPACGRELATTALVCPGCGAPTARAQAAARTLRGAAAAQLALSLAFIAVLLYAGYCAAVGGR